MASAKKTIFIITMGIMFEYYDFAIYGLVAPYLSKNFFPQEDSTFALLQTLGIFAAGYAARPVGGLIGGIIGDRQGRVKPFLYSIMLMAATTLGIALLPTYAQIGWIAGLMLLILRIVQGMAFGSETPGAITLLIERYSDSENRGVTGSFFVTSTAVGAVSGTLVMLLLSVSFSSQQMLEWGWRLPFLLGSSLAFVGFWLRRNLKEVSIFLQPQVIESATIRFISLLLRNNYKQLLQGFVLVFFNAGLIAFGQTFAAFLNAYYSYPLKEVYKNLTIGFVLSLILPTLLGRLSDQVGRKLLLIVACLLFIACSFPLFNLLETHSRFALFTAVAFIYFIAILFSCCYIPLLTELFPTSVRYTGVAICLNLGTAIGGIIPFVFHYLVYTTGKTFFSILLLNGIALITFLITLTLNAARPNKLI